MAGGQGDDASTDGAGTKPDGAAKPRRGRPRSAGAAGAAASSAASGENATIIKKYANRRLYDTGASRYVTLEDLAAMVREGRHFIVLDARSGEDITRPVLGQIIFEQEAKDGPSLLPTEFLRQVISYYGDGVGAVVPSYLEASMRAFERGAEEMRAEMGRMAGGTAPDPAKLMEAGMSAGMSGLAAPLKLIEEQTRRNQEAFMGAMRLFTPFGGVGDAKAAPRAPEPARGPADAPPDDRAGEADRSDELDALREQIAAMQRKIDRLGDG